MSRCAARWTLALILVFCIYYALDGVIHFG